jgi:hypothetical protein
LFRFTAVKANCTAMNGTESRFRLMTHEEMLEYLRAAGFSDAKVIEREPYEFEYQTRRMYALAGKAMSQ